MHKINTGSFKKNVFLVKKGTSLKPFGKHVINCDKGFCIVDRETVMYFVKHAVV